MIMPKLEQQKYNIVENCNAIANVGLTTKKNKFSLLNKFSKQIILIYTIIR